MVDRLFHLSRDPGEYKTLVAYKRETWNRLRSYSPADLKVFMDMAVSQVNLSYDQYSLAKDEDREKDMEHWRSEHRRAIVLRDVVGSLINYHLWQGGTPPPYDELETADEERRSNIGFEQLPTRTQQFAKTAARVAYEAMSVKRIVREVAEAEDVSESTAYKWLCDRNPRYEANAPASDRLTALLDLMDEMSTSREVP